MNSPNHELMSTLFKTIAHHDMEAAKQRVYLVMTAFFFPARKRCGYILNKNRFKEPLRGTAGSDNDT